MSNSLDSEQAQCFLGPDLGSNCLQAYQQELLAGKEFKNFFYNLILITHVFLKYVYAQLSSWLDLMLGLICPNTEKGLTKQIKYLYQHPRLIWKSP